MNIFYHDTEALISCKFQPVFDFRRLVRAGFDLETNELISTPQACHEGIGKIYWAIARRKMGSIEIEIVREIGDVATERFYCRQCAREAQILVVTRW